MKNVMRMVKVSENGAESIRAFVPNHFAEDGVGTTVTDFYVPYSFRFIRSCDYEKDDLVGTRKITMSDFAVIRNGKCADNVVITKVFEF